MKFVLFLLCQCFAFWPARDLTVGREDISILIQLESEKGARTAQPKPFFIII